MTLARVMASIADAQGRGHFQSEEVSLLSPNASVIDCLDVILNFGKDRLTARGSKSRESGCCWEYQLPKIDQRSWWLELDTRGSVSVDCTTDPNAEVYWESGLCLFSAFDLIPCKIYEENGFSLVALHRWKSQRQQITGLFPNWFDGI